MNTASNFTFCRTKHFTFVQELCYSGAQSQKIPNANASGSYRTNKSNTAESDQTVTLGDVVIYLFFEYENAT